MGVVGSWKENPKTTHLILNIMYGLIIFCYYKNMWNEENNELTKEFNFNDFKSALDFVNKIGEVAEHKNHHPDIELGWGKVKVTLTTHSEGKVTQKDHDLAQKIDKI